MVNKYLQCLATTYFFKTSISINFSNMFFSRPFFDPFLTLSFSYILCFFYRAGAQEEQVLLPVYEAETGTQ